MNPSPMLLFLLAVLLALSASGAGEGNASPPPVPLWGEWEGTFTAAEDAAPETILRVELTAPSGGRRTVSGFWDGERVWRVRFMPNEEGVWRYRTRAEPAVRGLDGRTGSFRCRRGKGTRFLEHGPVRVAASGRYLEHADGTPFFWLGDTAWNGALLSTREDWETYLRDRAAKRFTAVQFVMTQWRTAHANAEGEVAFTGRESIRIHPAFFRRLDERIRAVNDHGLLGVPVLLWAIRGEENPGWSLPEDQAIRLARYMVARYGARHLVWILAGDGNYTGEIAERWKRIGRAVFDQPDRRPVALHPGGMQWPYEAFREEPWLDLLGYQSGHGDDANTLRWIHSGPPAREWRRPPPRPVLNLEPPYEEHLAYQSRRPHTAHSVRRAAYWSLLVAPTAGLTYGAHGVWSWQEQAGVPLAHPNTGVARPWREAIGLPGSTAMKVLGELFASIRWWRLEPDESLLAEQPGQADPARFIAAARTREGDLALLYLPEGGDVVLRPGALRPDLEARWVDPRTGARLPARPEAEHRYRAPDTQDWLLLFSRPEGARP